jgi:CRISPR-associated protein Csb2
MFARRPPGVPLRSAARRPSEDSAPRHLIQFAITGAVLPEMRAVCRVTSRFRQRVLDRFVQRCTGRRDLRWRQAPPEVRKHAVLLSGLDPEQGKSRDHEHSWFLVWPEASVPARLIVWRAGTPFTSEEHCAVMSAAEQEISWGTVPGRREWTVRLLPLDSAVPPPPGFDGQAHPLWESVTPYVPPRHRFRRGKPRQGEDVGSQVRRELDARGWPAARAEVEVVGAPQWTAVQLPPSQKRSRPFIGDRAGFAVRIRFDEPVVGPIMLGHSGHFGLGQFKPVT